MSGLWPWLPFRWGATAIRPMPQPGSLFSAAGETACGTAALRTLRADPANTTHQRLHGSGFHVFDTPQPRFARHAWTRSHPAASGGGVVGALRHALRNHHICSPFGRALFGRVDGMAEGSDDRAQGGCRGGGSVVARRCDLRQMAVASSLLPALHGSCAHSAPAANVALSIADVLAGAAHSRRLEQFRAERPAEP